MLVFRLPLWVMVVLAAMAVPQPLRAAVFGSTEFARNRATGFPKWVAMVERDAMPEPSAAGAAAASANHLPGAGSCVPNPRFVCASDRMASFVASQRSASATAQLDAVNRFFNAQPYVTDPVNWGVPDYWASLREFLRKDGDCEDYAIAKYETLKQLGWKVADIRIVVVQDENIVVQHAILAVQTAGRTVILDNQIQDVLPDTAIVHYRPFYSLNDAGFWVHTPRAR